VNKQSLATGLLVCGLVALATVMGVLVAKYQQSDTPPDIAGLLWPEPKTLSSFTLIDQENKVFTLADLHGKWSLLFFGFTHCPGPCPTTLAVMKQVREELAQVRDLQFVFVTVDPDRDTSARIKQYLASFHPEFVGLGGSTEQISALTRQIGLAYFLDKTESEENYLVDHSASLFLVDPQGRLVGIFSAPHETSSIVDRFDRIRTFIDG